MNNRRTKRRMHSLFYLRVYDQKSNKLAGRLVNVSQEGMMLMSEKPIEPKLDFKFKMDLPKSMAQNAAISFQAQSRWCMKDPNPKLFDTGFKIIEISSESLKALNELIRDYTFDRYEEESIPA